MHGKPASHVCMALQLSWIRVLLLPSASGSNSCDPATAPCRWWILSSVHTRLRTLVRQLGLGDSCLCFDVTAAQKEHTSQFLLDVGKSLASAPPSQQLSALIQRLPLDEQLSVVSCHHACLTLPGPRMHHVHLVWYAAKYRACAAASSL